MLQGSFESSSMSCLLSSSSLFLGGRVGFQEISFFHKADMASLLELDATGFAEAAGVDDEDDEDDLLALDCINNDLSANSCS
jgi:hypothetical protein